MFFLTTMSCTAAAVGVDLTLAIERKESRVEMFRCLVGGKNKTPDNAKQKTPVKSPQPTSHTADLRRQTPVKSPESPRRRHNRPTRPKNRPLPSRMIPRQTAINHRQQFEQYTISTTPTHKRGPLDLFFAFQGWWLEELYTLNKPVAQVLKKKISKTKKNKNGGIPTILRQGACSSFTKNLDQTMLPRITRPPSTAVKRGSPASVNHRQVHVNQRQTTPKIRQPHVNHTSTSVRGVILHPVNHRQAHVNQRQTSKIRQPPVEQRRRTASKGHTASTASSSIKQW